MSFISHFIVATKVTEDKMLKGAEDFNLIFNTQYCVHPPKTVQL